MPRSGLGFKIVITTNLCWYSFEFTIIRFDCYLAEVYIVGSLFPVLGLIVSDHSHPLFSPFYNTIPFYWTGKGTSTAGCWRGVVLPVINNLILNEQNVS